MSDRPIQVGDLVVAVKGCPECSYRIGRTFSVSRIDFPRGGGYHCGRCGWKEYNPEKGAGESDRYLLPLSWLKRIPPLDELESTKDTERLKETA